MSKRNRKLLVMPQGKPKPIDTKPLSDKAELMWQGVRGVQIAAAEAVNKAIEAMNEVTARHMAVLDDVDLSEWNFHVPTGQWVRKVKDGAP